MLPRIFYDNMLEGLEGKISNCDVYEEGNKYYIEMDLPGFKKENITLSCHKGTISIKAYSNEENSHQDKKYLCRERCYDKVERSFYLGNIIEDSIKAEFNNGTLKVTICKNDDEEKKLITIE